jgi:hypothetical protein
MRAQRGGKGIALLFDLGTRWGRVVNATAPEKSPGTHGTVGWVGARAGLDGCGKEEIACLHRGSIPEPFSP